MIYRFGIYAVALTLSAATLARSAEATLPAPAPVRQVIYQHWPEQFVQWVGPELPYSMFELYVDATKAAKPTYDVVLTERATGKRIHYSNQPALVEFNKRTGSDSYLAEMQLDRPTGAGSDGNYYFRFTDHAGQPVLWQFVQGSDVAERGGGLSPAGIQPPVIMYREQSAVAGQGTALKIGNVVSAADVWTEIAQPPYFVPYHGALTENLEIAVFTQGGDEWKTAQAPTKLETGAAWKLDAGNGHECVLTVTALQGSTATLSEEDTYFPDQKATIEAQFVNGVWSTKKVHFAPAAKSSSKGITLAFSPALQTTTQGAKFELFSGSKTKIANGTVSVDQAGARIDWQFKDPQWLKSKPASAQAKTDRVAGTSGQ